MLDSSYERVEKELGVDWAGAGFGVKLNGEDRLLNVPQAFVCSIICVEEGRLPIRTQTILIDSEPMILRGDKAAF